MATSFYPQIDPRGLASLLSIYGMMEQNPDYLTDAECPYDDGLKADLAKIMSPKVIEVPVEVEKIVERRVEVAVAASESGGKRGPKAGIGGGNIDVIAKELQSIIDDLRQLKTDAKTLQPADKVQIIKTRSVLVEKMIANEERVTNVRRMSRFMSTIMGIMDDLMTDDQRQQFMKRLEPFATEE